MSAIFSLFSTLIALIKRANPLSGEQVWKCRKREQKNIRKTSLEFQIELKKPLNDLIELSFAAIWDTEKLLKSNWIDNACQVEVFFVWKTEGTREWNFCFYWHNELNKVFT